MHRFLSPIVFSTVFSIGLAMSYTLYDASQQAKEMRAEQYADEAVDRVVERLGHHVSLLRATKSFFTAGEKLVSRSQFNTFVSGLEADQYFPGIQGIGFAELINTGQEKQVEENLARDYGIERPVWPNTDQSRRTPITMLEPLDPRNNAALGFDMFHEPVRRKAMETALLTGTFSASGPVELVQEITANKQTGFLVYVPLHKPDDSLETDELEESQPLAKGFVYSPFRAGDLFTAALSQRPKLPIRLLAYDMENKDTPLYADPVFEGIDHDDIQFVSRNIDFSGRHWAIQITVDTKEPWRMEEVTPFIVGAVSFLLALMLAQMTWAQLRALQTARTMQRLSEQNLSQKELLLQEMKHRIKNSIARIMAISRHTILHSSSLEEFSDSFTARLQAMANAQDMLTRSHWQRADLLDLLAKELEQVLGRNSYQDQISGPKVDLDEASAQALGLTFHELATNALKYSDVASSKDALSVNWSVTESGKQRELKILWQETSKNKVEAPTHKGFGTKLIDANILGELRGTIERRYSEHGLEVEISIPLKLKS